MEYKRIILSKEYYSNCLIEALKAKIKHPFKVRIIYIPPKLNESRCPHFMWTDGKFDYDFGTDDYLKCVLVFKGRIRARALGFAKAYKQKRKELFHNHKKNKYTEDT